MNPHFAALKTPILPPPPSCEVSLWQSFAVERLASCPQSVGSSSRWKIFSVVSLLVCCLETLFFFLVCCDFKRWV